MISLTPMATADDAQRDRSADLAPLSWRGPSRNRSRRCARPIHRAAASHCTMAAHYSAKAVALLEAAA